jgi:hypothetical protein
MSVWSRVKAGLFGGARSPYAMLPAIYPSSSGAPPDLGTEDLLEGHESMPWLRAVGDKVGSAVACTEWEIVFGVDEYGKATRLPQAKGAGAPRRAALLGALRKAGQLREAPPDHPFYAAMERPNPFMTRTSITKLTELHLDLVGAAYWIKQRGPLGVPVGFWPVPPHWIMEHPTSSRPSFRVAWRTWQVLIPESEVVWFHEPAAADPYGRGSGIGWSLGDELEVDEYAAKMAKQLFFNQARPDFLFIGGSSDAELRRLERDWVNRLQGFWRAHKPYFMLGGDKARASDYVHEFQKPTMEQLVYPGLRKIQRDIILQTWGVPPELFGIVENSNRATIEAAEYLFTRWVVWPKVERLRGFLQRIVDEYDDRGILTCDSPVAEDKEYQLNAAKAAPYSLLINEWRALQGLEPLPGGNVFVLPLNSYATEDPADATTRPAAAGGRPPMAEDPAPAPPAA